MAELLPDNLLDRCKSLADLGNLYLHEYPHMVLGVRGHFRPIPDPPFLAWDDLTEPALQSIYLSPNGFNPSQAVGRANTAVFLERFHDHPGIVTDNPFLGLGIRVADLTEEMAEALTSLLEYPVLDEEGLAREEDSKKIEAWKDWVERDFLRGIEKNLDACLIGFEDDDDDYSCRLFEFFCRTLYRVGGEWIEESGSFYPYKWEEGVKLVTRENCSELGLFVVEWEGSDE